MACLKKESIQGNAARHERNDGGAPGRVAGRERGRHGTASVVAGGRSSIGFARGWIVLGVLGHAGGREISAWPTSLKDLGESDGYLQDDIRCD